jgi:hypothetical protein
MGGWESRIENGADGGPCGSPAVFGHWILRVLCTDRWSAGGTARSCRTITCHWSTRFMIDFAGCGGPTDEPRNAAPPLEALGTLPTAAQSHFEVLSSTDSNSW